MSIFITDKSMICPFEINAELVAISRRITDRHFSEESKYLAIFNWIQENTIYDSKGNTKMLFGLPKKYRTSLETFYAKKGNCAELSFLYIAMARSSALESQFVMVSKNNRGEEVCHACATAGSRLVDPAHHAFGISHLEYEILEDIETSRLFCEWNGGAKCL